MAPRHATDVHRTGDSRGRTANGGRSGAPTGSRHRRALLTRRRLLPRAGAADPHSLHVVALVDMLWGDSAGKALDRAITYMQAAARLDDRSAPILADLAAAYVVRAERRQSPHDLLEAIEAATHALEL